MPFVSRGKKRQHEMRLSPQKNEEFILVSFGSKYWGVAACEKKNSLLLTTTCVGPSSLFRVASAGVLVRACRPPNLIFSCVSPTAASVVVSLDEYN